MAKKLGVKGMSRKQRAATMIAIREQHAGRSPRAISMNAREDTPTTETTFAGGTITDNNEDDRVQILYDERPSPDMIKQLKGSGWRWAPSIGVWQRKRTPAAMTSAKQITGAS